MNRFANAGPKPGAAPVDVLAVMLPSERSGGATRGMGWSTSQIARAASVSSVKTLRALRAAESAGDVVCTRDAHPGAWRLGVAVPYLWRVSDAALARIGGAA